MYHISFYAIDSLKNTLKIIIIKFHNLIVYNKFYY